MKRTNKKFSYKDISIEDLETEISRERYKHSFSKFLKNTIAVLLIITSISSIIATLFIPVIEVTNSSMEPLLNNGEIVLSIKTTKFKTGDIVAFYQGNKILIKRVIGVQGDWINIDEGGNVYVNGEKIKEKYVKELLRGNSEIDYPIQVEDNSLFVLSDDRATTTDSRNIDIGNIKKENIIGKIFFKIWPLKRIGTV